MGWGGGVRVVAPAAALRRGAPPARAPARPAPGDGQPAGPAARFAWAGVCVDTILAECTLRGGHTRVQALEARPPRKCTEARGPRAQSPVHAHGRTTHTARPRDHARGFGGRGAHAPPEHNSSAQSGGATINAKRAPTRSSRSMSRHRKVRPRRMVMSGERERVEHGGHARESTRGSDFRGWQSHWACRRLEETRTRDACGARRGAGCYGPSLVAECHVVRGGDAPRNFSPRFYRLLLLLSRYSHPRSM